LVNNIDYLWPSSAPNCPDLAESISYALVTDSTEDPYTGAALSTFLSPTFFTDPATDTIVYSPTMNTPASIQLDLVATITMTGDRSFTDQIDFSLEKLDCSPALFIDKPSADFTITYIYNDADVTLNLEDFSPTNTNLNDFSIVDNPDCPCTDCVASFTGYTFKSTSGATPVSSPVPVELLADDSNQFLWTLGKCQGGLLTTHGSADGECNHRPTKSFIVVANYAIVDGVGNVQITDTAEIKIEIES
jgi:hypothetical protein